MLCLVLSELYFSFHSGATVCDIWILVGILYTPIYSGLFNGVLFQFVSAWNIWWWLVETIDVFRLISDKCTRLDNLILTGCKNLPWYVRREYQGDMLPQLAEAVERWLTELAEWRHSKVECVQPAESTCQSLWNHCNRHNTRHRMPNCCAVTSHSRD